MLLFQILFENRHKGDRGADCLVSVDGVDFQISQHGAGFSSHKFGKKSGLRYEIALCIQTGDVVWVNGPFPCGRWNDLTIFRSGLMTELDYAERVEADDGYVGEHPQYVKCPAGFANPPECEFMQQRVRNRQETINNRLKFWGILKQFFRHREFLCRHGDVVRAILVITQLAIDQGEKLFPCGYKDPPFNTTSTTGNNNSSDDGDDDDSAYSAYSML